jgi:histidinol-phosphate/aromatic aminotransferase/cobyric acid decarboxylase-like protein
MDTHTATELAREPHGSADDPDLLDFSANTNPAVPPETERVYREAFGDARSYPAEPPAAYCEAAAAAVDCDPEQVIPTPGGLAAIRQTIALAVDAGDTALVPTPSFGEYAREVRLRGGKPEFVAASDVLAADPAPHALAVVCTPNNPTGRGYDRKALTDFAARCRATDTLLLVDEAFLGFTDRPSLAGEPGVVVARALTKLYGLPGIRAGYAVATGEWATALRGSRRTWNLGSPALAVGTHCLRQRSFVRETRERVRRERERLAAALSAWFGVADSQAPFLLVDVSGWQTDDTAGHDTDCDVAGFVAALRKQGVAVRDATTFRGLDSHVRVAVRRPAENDRLLEAIRAVRD